MKRQITSPPIRLSFQILARTWVNVNQNRADVLGRVSRAGSKAIVNDAARTHLFRTGEIPARLSQNQGRIFLSCTYSHLSDHFKQNMYALSQDEQMPIFFWRYSDVHSLKSISQFYFKVKLFSLLFLLYHQHMTTERKNFVF